MTSFKPSYQNFDTRDQKWVQKLSRILASLVNFSTSSLPLGTWIDGKNIAKKTVAIGSMPNATSKSVAHEATFSNIVSIDGWASDGTDWIQMPNHTPATLISVKVDNTNIVVTCSGIMSSYTGYVTIWYTV